MEMKQMILPSLCFSLLLIKLTVVKALISCSNVKYAYTTKGFDDGDVPKAAISGFHLKPCAFVCVVICVNHCIQND
ncbi:hypothetical protein TNCV_4334872 [Trichonephila clavipes]|uniref:Secreted protein n=1 Tax=Trichonephila clavipes TaxID=2585209 RepID=A0A8X6V0P5_TRICX|nr:hypothetical protein TNCV_4334872 [Trichonephila clavipes]